MKKFCITLELIIIILVTIACGTGLERGGKDANAEYLRLRVLANSDEKKDQDVKYLVRDELTAYLSPYVADCRDKQQVEKTVASIQEGVKQKIDAVLKREGFDYQSKISIENEKFPTRTYGDLVLESGYYDAVVVELGKGEGSNWRCVLYPPLCFSTRDVEYRSKILDIIANFKKG